mmetsp:Transcript_85151/g.189252  ORF Transcript_85151/g.189252 Transcript_85151/m.189252 type:complete len:451 (-) Transcript_85151:3-1355(-)
MPIGDGDDSLLESLQADLQRFELLDEEFPARDYPRPSPWRRRRLKLCALTLVVTAFLVAACYVAGIFESVTPMLASAAAVSTFPSFAQGGDEGRSSGSYSRPARATDRSAEPHSSTSRTALGTTSSTSTSTAYTTTTTSTTTATAVPQAQEQLVRSSGEISPARTCAPSALDRFAQCQAASAEVQELRCASRVSPKRQDAAPRISRAVYINLDRDSRRRAWMEEQLRQLRRKVTATPGHRNFTVQRLRAVDIGAAKLDPHFEAVRSRGFNPAAYPKVEGKWGVAGCMFSHLAILWSLRREAAGLLARGEVWLILEDDAIVTTKIESAWTELWPWVPTEWDLVRLGWFGGSNCQARVNDHIDLALWSDPPPHGPCSYCGSHAYVVNPAAIERVIHRLEASRIMHVDCLLSAPTPPLEDPASLPPLRVFAARPLLSKANETFPSDRVDGRLL